MNGSSGIGARPAALPTVWNAAKPHRPHSAALPWEWRVLALCCLLALALLLPPRLRAVSAPADEDVAVPILMYHSLLKSAPANDYILSPAAFEEDLRALRRRGYETVWISDLIAYVEEGVPLPDKPVALTFDDGHLNTLTYALPLLEKYNAKATVSVVGTYADEAERLKDPNPHYAYADWEELAQLRDSGRFEILSHSYALHENRTRPGAARRQGEALTVYQEILTGDTLRMQDVLWERLGLRPAAYTFPYGLVDKDAEQFLRELGFRATLSCYEHVNRLVPGKQEALFSLGRFNRSPKRSAERILGEL